MRDVVWVAWDRQTLMGMYALQADAERRVQERRSERGVHGDKDPQGWAIRAEPWSISPPSTSPRTTSGAVVRALLDRVDREWGLLDIPEMGTGHFFHLDTYLLVPYRNRLTAPAFQFTMSRELWPGFREVLQVFRDVGADDFSIMAWFVSRQGSADGAIPALLIRDEPERVLEAARSTTADW